MRWFAPFAFFLLGLMGAAVLTWAARMVYVSDRAQGHIPAANFMIGAYIAGIAYFLIVALFNLRGFIQRVRRPNGID